ncbi:MAG: hypothetical protein HYU97_07575 [Deltaproteobacteria bacterium]|nr:hypothetical protein [Deltaproteobacteria bacterium]
MTNGGFQKGSGMKRYCLTLISLLFLMACSSGGSPDDPAKQEGQPESNKPNNAPTTSFDLKKITDEVCQTWDPRTFTYTADPNSADYADAKVNEVEISRYRTLDYETYSVSTSDVNNLEIAYFSYRSNGGYSDKSCYYYQNNTDRVEKELWHSSSQAAACDGELSPEYNADGKVVSKTTVSTCTQFIDGRKDTTRSKVFYDPETGREIRQEEDYGNDGSINYIVEYDYDPTTGKLREERYDENGDGIFEERLQYTYFNNGRISTLTILNENNRRTELKRYYESAQSIVINQQRINYTMIAYEFNPTTGATTRRCYYNPIYGNESSPTIIGDALACVPPR